MSVRSILLVLAAVAMLVACDETAPPTDVGPVPDTLSINTTALSVQLRAGSESATQSFVVSAQRPGVAWTASSSASWLRLSPNSGVTPSVVTVTVSSAGLPPGEHSALITLSSPSSAGPPLTAVVRLTVLPQPSLAVSPTSASFTGVVGQGGIGNVIVSINNSGTGQLSWAAAASAPWITLAPSAGSAPGVLSIGVNPTGLAAGTHTGSVTVTAAGANGSPATIPVTLALAPPPNVTITAAAAPAAGGSVTGGGSFTVGSSVTLSAVANAGYTFANWTENGAVVSSSATYTFTANTNRSLVANFPALPPVAISTASSPAAGGATSGGGVYPVGSAVTVSATPNAGYTFTSWMESGVVVSTSPSFSFTASTSRALVAVFTQSSVIITTSANPTNGGVTSGGGTFAAGSTVTVTAAPSFGFAFTSWTSGGSIVSTSPSYTFTATANRSLIANFSSQQGNISISTTSSPAAGGTTSGGGTFESGTIVTVVATPSSGYTFSSWTEGGTIVSSQTSYPFVASASRVLVANFTPTQPANIAITTSSNPAAGGTTTGGGIFTSGTSVTVAATPAFGYTFVNWTEGGTVVSSVPSYTFTASANRALVANFTTTPAGNVTVSTSSNPASGGNTIGGGTFAPGTIVTVTATPASGYTFTSWTEGATVVSTSTSYTFTASANRALVASFTLTPAGNVTINTSSNPAGGGTTSGGGSFAPGTSVTVTAVAATSYTFRDWTEGATVVSTTASYTFNASSNRSLVANFVPIRVTSVDPCCNQVLPRSDINARVRVSSVFPIMSVVVRFAGRDALLPYSSFFDRYEGPAGQAGLPAGTHPLSVIVTDDNGNTTTFQTSVIINPPAVITTSANPAAGGTTTGGGSYTPGTSVTVTATPNTGYVFSSWTEGGTVVSTTSSYTFTATVSGNRALVANFTVSDH